MAIGDLTLAQIAKLIMSTGVKDNSVTTSVEETLVAKPILEVTVAHDSTSIPSSKAYVVTSKMGAANDSASARIFRMDKHTTSIF